MAAISTNSQSEPLSPINHRIKSLYGLALSPSLIKFSQLAVNFNNLENLSYLELMARESLETRIISILKYTGEPVEDSNVISQMPGHFLIQFSEAALKNLTEAHRKMAEELKSSYDLNCKARFLYDRQMFYAISMQLENLKFTESGENSFLDGIKENVEKTLSGVPAESKKEFLTSQIKTLGRRILEAESSGTSDAESKGKFFAYRFELHKLNYFNVFKNHESFCKSLSSSSIDNSSTAAGAAPATYTI